MMKLMRIFKAIILIYLFLLKLRDLNRMIPKLVVLLLK